MFGFACPGAELITQSQPGDLFVVKNVGNIVPPANVAGSTNSTAAAIEFAVEVLRANDIVVCGHWQCGAIDVLLRPRSPGSTLRHLEEWLGLAEPVRRIVQAQYGHISHEKDRLKAAAQENVLFALENLQSYPCVQQRLANGSLHIHGWFFKIATAELFAFDPGHVPIRAACHWRTRTGLIQVVNNSRIRPRAAARFL